MSKHTPGPWALKADAAHFDSMTTIIGGSRQNSRPHATWPAYELVVQVGGASSVSTLEANARLIAAAPELLAVLQELQESASYWSEYDVPLGIVDRINSVIIKATGETK